MKQGEQTTVGHLTEGLSQKAHSSWMIVAERPGKRIEYVSQLTFIQPFAFLLQVWADLLWYGKCRAHAPVGGRVRLLPRRIWFHNEVANHGDRPLFIVVLILFALIALMVSRAAAAVHPVPLEKNVDAAKCLECHEDKTKGKAVHSAIAMGCLSCHQIRVNKDTTRVKLITATPYNNCLSCHSDKDATQIKGQVHPPAVRDCLTCHDPHTSANKNQLLKATSGEKKDNL